MIEGATSSLESISGVHNECWRADLPLRSDSSSKLCMLKSNAASAPAQKFAQLPHHRMAGVATPSDRNELSAELERVDRPSAMVEDLRQCRMQVADKPTLQYASVSLVGTTMLCAKLVRDSLMQLPGAAPSKVSALNFS